MQIRSIVSSNLSDRHYPMAEDSYVICGQKLKHSQEVKKKIKNTECKSGSLLKIDLAQLSA
jgi:hypothetical protein